MASVVLDNSQFSTASNVLVANGLVLGAAGVATTGDVTVGGNLSVVGDTTVSADVLVGGNTVLDGNLSVGNDFSATLGNIWGATLITGSETIAGAIPDSSTVQLTKLNAILGASPIRDYAKIVFVSAVAQPVTTYANGTINTQYGVSVPAYQSGSANTAVAITGAQQGSGGAINFQTVGAASTRTTTFSFTNGSGIASTAAGVTYYYVIV